MIDDTLRACCSAGPSFHALYCAVMVEDVYAGQRDPRRAETLSRALEYARKRTMLLIAEAGQRQCFFYKGQEDVNSAMLILWFTNGADQEYRRTINCAHFFETQGLYFGWEDVCAIRREADQLVFAAGGFKDFGSI